MFNLKIISFYSDYIYILYIMIDIDIGLIFTCVDRQIDREIDRQRDRETDLWID